MGNNKMIKTAAAVALGASVVATSVAPGAASAAATYKVKSGKLVTVKTGKVVKGFKTFNKVLYKDGKKFTGLRSGKYYKAGKLATGTYKGKYYSKGTAFTGLKSGVYYKAGVKGTGVYKSVYYKAGKKGTGLVGGVYYKNGAKGTGSYKGIQYKSGKAVTGVVNDVYFNNGVKATAVVEGVQYVDGDIANEVYKGVLYVDGKAAQGEVEGVLYKDGNKVTDTVEGVIYEDGKVFSGVKDGKVYLDGKLDEEAPAIEVEAAQTVAYGATAPTAASLVKSVTDNSGEKIEATATITFDGKEVSAIDTKVAGEYTINYVAVDKNGNEGKASVKVTVLNPAVDVTAVTSITATGVTVDFTALTGDQANVTVEVIDNNGKKVEVTPVLLADGSKTAEFSFVKTFASDYKFEGVWTVNGKEFNFNVINQLADIKTTATGTNQIKFQAALDVAGIKYADAAKIGEYQNAIKNATKAPETLEDVQKLISTVDEKYVTDAEKIAKATPVLTATTQAALLAALKANFSLVNEDWIVEYDTAIASKEAKDVLPGDAATIQTAIETVNINQINAANKATGNLKATTAAEQAKVTALIEKWHDADNTEDKTDTDKADALKESKLAEAQFAITEAKTATTLYNALVAYANLISSETTPNVKAEDIKADNKQAYWDVLDAKGANGAYTLRPTVLTAIQAGTLDVKTSIIAPGDAKAVESTETGALKALNELTTNSTNAEVLAALKAVQALTKDSAEVKDASAVEYKTAVLNFLKTGDITTTSGGSASTFDKAKTETLVLAVNATADAKAFAEAHKAVLTKATADVKAEDLAAAAAAQKAFTELSVAAQAKYTGTATANQVAAAKADFTKEFNKLTKAEDAVKALDTLDNKFFAKLTEAQKAEVAQLVIDAALTGYTDYAAIETAVTAKITTYKNALNAINAAKTLAEVKAAIITGGAAKDVLTVLAGTEDLTADAIFTGKPAAGYTTLAEITAQYK